MTVQDELVRWCESKEGTPYQWGGTGPDYDCSGLVQAAYREVAGIEIGRDTAAQQASGWAVPSTEAIPSDLCFFGDLAGAHAHVGMYIGGGRMVNAPHTGAVVRIDSVTAWSDSGERLRGFRRYIAPPQEADVPLSADDLTRITTTPAPNRPVRLQSQTVK